MRVRRYVWSLPGVTFKPDVRQLPVAVSSVRQNASLLILRTNLITSPRLKARRVHISRAPSNL